MRFSPPHPLPTCQLSERDREAAKKLLEEEYEQAGALIECGCCFGSFCLEDMAQCADGHLFCQECCGRAAREVIGQVRAMERWCAEGTEEQGCMLRMVWSDNDSAWSEEMKRDSESCIMLAHTSTRLSWCEGEERGGDGGVGGGPLKEDGGLVHACNSRPLTFALLAASSHGPEFGFPFACPTCAPS